MDTTSAFLPGDILPADGPMDDATIGFLSSTGGGTHLQVDDTRLMDETFDFHDRPGMDATTLDLALPGGGLEDAPESPVIAATGEDKDTSVRSMNIHCTGLSFEDVEREKDCSMEDHLAYVKLAEDLRIEMDNCSQMQDLETIIMSTLAGCISENSHRYHNIQVLSLEMAIRKIMQIVSQNEGEEHALLRAATSEITGIKLLDKDKLHHCAIGKDITELVRKNKPKQSRQFLSILCGIVVRDIASQLVGRTISKREWAAARQHRLSQASESL